MPRLPTPGSDTNVWGDILNEFLTEAHEVDGSLKASALNVAGAETTGQKGEPGGYAPLDSGGKVPSANLPASHNLTDASTTTKGVVKLSTSPSTPTNPVAIATTDPKVIADQAAGIASIRTLGYGPNQAAQGSEVNTRLSAVEDSRLVNAGDYDPSHNYQTNDIVRVGSRAYVLEEHTGEPPVPADDNVRWNGEVYPSAAAQPNDFARTISCVGRAGNKVFLGYGDYNTNSGPVNVGQVDASDLRVIPENVFTGFQSEQIILFRRLSDGRILVPPVDPRGSSGGNYLERSINGEWAQHTNRISDLGLHIFDLIEGPSGVLFACGSAYESTTHGQNGPGGATIWKSIDQGDTWTRDYIISGPNSEESNRFYWLAVVGDTVYARNAEVGSDGEAERMLQWTQANGWGEIAHPLPSNLGPGQKFRGGYVLPGGHWGYSNVTGPLRFFDGTTVTTLDAHVVGFDVGDDGALYYATTSGVIKRIPASGLLVGEIIATTAGGSSDDLIGMVVLPGEQTFVFGGSGSHVRVYTLGQRNPWRPLAPAKVTGEDGKILVDLLPAQGPEGAPGTETIAFGDGGINEPTFPSGGFWVNDTNLYLQGSSVWLMGSVLLYDYADLADQNTGYAIPLLSVPSWMTAVPATLASLDAVYKAGNYGVQLEIPERRMRITMSLNVYGTDIAAVNERIPETIVGSNVSRFSFSPSPGVTYLSVTVRYPFDIIWGDIPTVDDDFNVTGYVHGLSGTVPFGDGAIPLGHLDLLYQGRVDTPSNPSCDGHIAINTDIRALSFPVGDRP